MPKTKLPVTILFISLFSFPVYAQIIRTVGGGGPVNLQALQTGLPQPLGTAVDSSGNLYVSLSQLNQIWKITPSGNVTLFAGNGADPFDGDGIQAVNATLSQPQGLAFDTAGNLYVADVGHSRIRKISTGGVISTVAGNGTSGFSGDGGPGTAARLNNAVSVALDSSNNLYIVDQANQRIRMVSAAGTISTLAGNGTASFSGDGGASTSASLNQPSGVAVSSAGVVYIADAANFRVRKITGGIISTVAGNGTSGNSGDGGPATSAQLNTITGVTLDSLGNLYILEANDLRAISSGQSTIVKIAGGPTAGYSGDGGPPNSATFQFLAALALDSSGANGYLADAGNNRIRKITATTVTTIAGNGSVDFNGEGLPATSASVLVPTWVTTNNLGSLVFTDNGSSSIRKVTLGTGILSTLAGTGLQGTTPDGGTTAGPLNNPSSPIFDAAGNIYFVERNKIRKISAGVYSTVANSANASGFAGDGGPATAAQLNTPAGLAVAANGDLYVADSLNNRIRVISAQSGTISTIAGTGAGTSTGDGGLATNATLNNPYGLSLDGAGNLFVTELQGNRVRKIVLSNNVITTVAGNGGNLFADGVAATATGVSAPFSVFADQSGNLFIADEAHNRVRKVTAATGIISTVAGNGIADFSGDGGLATSASVTPLSVTVDRAQNLYIADISGRLRTAPVLACFFTVSSPIVYLNSASGTGSITVTATDPSCPYTVSSSSPFVTVTSGASGTGSNTVTFSYTADPGQNRTATVLIGGQSFIVQQAGVFGQYNVGFFNPNGPTWALDSNGSGGFDAGDRVFAFAGQPGAIAVVGDWNGDGRTKVGYYLNGFWALDYNGNGVYDGTGPGGDKFYGFGGAGSSYVPVVGDWNGDGRTKVGFYKDGFWALDTNGNGSFDAGDSFFGFGGNGAGEIPVVGDWNGDKHTKIGYFFNGQWVLDYDGNGSFNGSIDKNYTTFPYAAGDKPVIGDWTGDGKTKIGIFRGGFWIIDNNGNGTYDGVGAGQDKFYGFGGNVGEIPIVADWNGSGTSKIGIYVNGFWVLDFNGNGGYDGTGPGGDRFIAFGGAAANQPIIGRW